MGSQTVRQPKTSNLLEVLDRVLDKGCVIDLWVRLSLVGIEVVTLEARIVIASVDTFLHCAEEITEIERWEEESDDLEGLREVEPTSESWASRFFLS